METLLTERFEALYRSYGTGGNRTVLEIKQRIANVLESEPNFLRIDAAYFLLVNADYMAVRALSGAISERPTALAMSTVLSEPILHNNALAYLDIVLNDLRKSSADRPITAHEILRALDRTWTQMGNLMSWT